jgi:hypothetical protein
MPRDRGGRDGMPKPEMIREVLEQDPKLPTRQVQSAVWERFGGEVTPREIASVRRKLRQTPAAEPPAPAVPSAARQGPRKPPRKKRAAGVRAGDFAGAEVTVGQLSAILEVAQEVGGLRRLREAVQTAAMLRERVGAVDDRQLAVALDFLGRVTGKER